MLISYRLAIFFFLTPVHPRSGIDPLATTLPPPPPDSPEPEPAPAPEVRRAVPRQCVVWVVQTIPPTQHTAQLSIQLRHPSHL
jgi:hypothetical protein